MLCVAAVSCMQPVCLLLQLSLLGFKDKPIKPLLELLEHPNIIKVCSSSSSSSSWHARVQQPWYTLPARGTTNASLPLQMCVR